MTSVEEAAKLLAEERRKRAEAFSKALAALCDEHQCDLVPSITLTGSQVRSSVLVVPRDA